LVKTDDEALRSALAVTSLRLLISEAEKVITSLETGGTK
jgi:hypothetical protein